jgi:hypothetical protein
MKIKLDNKNHWRDDHIRAFILAAAREERPDLCKRGARELTAVVVYTRGRRRGSCCYAQNHSNYIKVLLPKHGSPDRVYFAQAITHELAHTRGLKHNQMNRCATYSRVGNYRTIYAWGEQLPLEVKAKKVTKRPTAIVKLAHAEKMLRLAITREKRAGTLRKKWQFKVRYHEKRATLMRVA